MHKLGLQHRDILTPKNYIIGVVLFALGTFIVFFSYQNIARSYDRRALSTVQALSTALDTEELRSLTGLESNYTTDSYLAMKKRLSHAYLATRDARGAYFFTICDGSIYFVVGSEPLGSETTSPSGQYYTEAPPEAYQLFSEGQPLMTRAYADRWGNWVSAYVLLPSEEGQIPLAFGLDFTSSSFYSHAKAKAIGVAFIMLALLALFLLASLALKNNTLLENEKTKANEKAALIKALQRKERQESMFLETTLQSLGEGVISADTEGRVVLMNRMAQNLTGWSLSETKGKPLRDVYRIVDGLTHIPCDTSWPYTVLKTGLPIKGEKLPAKLVQKSGSLLSIEDMVYPIIDEEKKVTGVVIIFIDATEKLQKKDELLFLSTHDKLTGLLNRQAFYEKLHEQDVSKNYPLVLMLLDINGLKLINEAYGHATGDSLLNEIAIILQRPWHKGQMVGRVDGDEFAIFFPNAGEETARRVSLEIQEALAEQAFMGYALTISHGYAKKEYAQTTISELHKRAEDDLFRNKFVENQSARQKMVDLLLQSLFKKSMREMEHSKRVGLLARRFGEYLGFSKDEQDALHTAGVMHDIGKIAVSSRILNKECRLDSEEWKEIQRHPEIGFNILSSVNEYAPIAEQVLCHHERWDGNGYPNKIAGDLIPLYSRILALCDSYDAMTYLRTYRSEVSSEEAIAEIGRCSGSQYDPSFAPLFIKMIREMA